MYASYFKFEDWEHNNFKLQGVSVAGIGTCFLLPELSLCIDVAQGLPFAFKAKNFLITHAHMDHAAGIPYIISQRTLLKMKPATFYMTPKMVPVLENIMNEWLKIDGHQYEYTFTGVEFHKEYFLDNNHYFKSFETFHRVESTGYTVFEKRKKLKPEFANKKEHEILELKKKGIPFTEELSLPIFTYTGDTKIEFWDHNPEVRKSKVLFMEVTYWDDKKTVADAREWGHIHLNEIAERIHQFEGDKLILTHISSRYSLDYCRKLLQSKIPATYWDRVDIFPATIK